MIMGSIGGACADQQAARLKEHYKAQGGAFFVPLYWLPETREIVRKHIPNHDENWVGFEAGLWMEIREEDKLLVLDEIGALFDQMDRERRDATWKRIGDWGTLRTQLGLMITFMDSGEAFLDLAYADPLLQPAFAWVLKRRGDGFDPQHIGSTLSSGETTAFFPVLIEHLLNSSEKQRLECFSRLFAQIAVVIFGPEKAAADAKAETPPD